MAKKIKPLTKAIKPSTKAIKPKAVTDEGEWFSVNDIEVSTLETADTIEEYHEQLSQIIRNIRRFNDEELARLADIVSRPWKQPRGPKRKIGRDVEVIENFLLEKEGSVRVPRKTAIEQIAKKYGMNVEAAAKYYDRLGGSGKTKKAK